MGDGKARSSGERDVYILSNSESSVPMGKWPLRGSSFIKHPIIGPPIPSKPMMTSATDFDWRNTGGRDEMFEDGDPRSSRKSI
jgi:hypothetical protein